MDRQRVLRSVFAGLLRYAQSCTLVDAAKLVPVIMPYMQTNLDMDTLMQLAASAESLQAEQVVFTIPSAYAVQTNSVSAIVWDPEIMAPLLRVRFGLDCDPQELNLPALPFFLAVQPDRYKAMDAILSGKSGKMMTQAVEKKGVKIIGWTENGFRELTTSKGPITKPEDLRGLKIRVVGSPIFIETFRALGANPVNMNWSEATTGFQQGVVDGQENPTNGINIPLKIWDYHKFHCDWHYIIDPLMLGVTPRVWKSFSPEDQKLLLECAAETEKYGKALSRLGMDDGSALAYLKSIGKLPETTDCYAVMEANGMTVSRLSNEQIAALAKATEGVRKDWTAKIGADLVKAAEEDMASVR